MSKNIPSLVWEDLPPVNHKPSTPPWERVVKQLQSNPGRWARIYAGKMASAASLASRIRHAEHASFSEGGFEAATRTIDGKTRVYARWIGKEESSEEKVDTGVEF